MTTLATSHRMDPAPFTGQEGTAGGDEVSISLPGGVQMLFCWCPQPAQPFQIGSPAGEADRDSSEKPTWVTFSHGFWLAKHPCSQAQWQALGMENRSSFTGDLSRPVEHVSWGDAEVYCNQAIVMGAWRMALPTEAQWEYACRAGGSVEQPFGISDGRFLHGQIANFDSTARYGGGFEWQNRKETLPEGCFPPNAWGLHDMHGQLFEWCSDWMADYPASSAELPLKDPKGPRNGRARIHRGGSWHHSVTASRSAFRGGRVLGERDAILGFRPALVPGVSGERS